MTLYNAVYMYISSHCAIPRFRYSGVLIPSAIVPASPFSPSSPLSGAQMNNHATVRKVPSTE